MTSNRTVRLALVALACLSCLTIVPAVAQEEGWIVPDDYVPPDDVPAVPPQPFALQGPIDFDETEFPTGTDMSNYAITTLNGSPIPGTLSFSSASNDISIGVGPGFLALVQAPLVRSRDLGVVFDIDFGVDVSRVVFNFAINCRSPMDTAQGGLRAFDSGGTLVGQRQVPGADFGFGFLEGTVDFSTPANFRRIETVFTGTQGCDRFAFDRLTYNDVAPAPAMPAPWLAVLAAILLGVGAWFARRRAA